jgi:hypothetical protein
MHVARFSNQSALKKPGVTFWTTLVVVALALADFVSSAKLSADDAPAKLPKDGWWVRYFYTLKLEEREITSRRTYSLVGSTVEHECSCRWVEMQTVETVEGRERTDVLKFLIPEKDLLEAERPLEGLIRCWRKTGEEQIEEQKFNMPLGVPGLVASADFYFGRDFALFPGPQQKSKAVEERRTIEYQRGRLEIETAESFRRITSRRALTNGERQEYRDEFKLWNDPAVAPGFAAAKSRIEYRRGDMPVRTFEIELVLEDFGIGAKSALPGNN